MTKSFAHSALLPTALLLLGLSTLLFAQHPTGLKVPDHWEDLAPHESLEGTGMKIPKYFSWASKHKFQPVHDQGMCGNCWANAAAGLMEGLLSIRKGIHLPLSTQDITSCDANNAGCNGGWFPGDFLTKTGDMSEHNCPYQDASGQSIACTFPEVQPIYKLSSFGYVGGPLNQFIPPTVTEMKAAMLAHGALWVTMDGSDPNFQSYTGGVLDRCATTPVIDHAVILIGWDDSKNAWYGRNSWGKSWGESGNFWIKYGCDGVGTQAVFGDL